MYDRCASMTRGDVWGCSFPGPVLARHFLHGKNPPGIPGAAGTNGREDPSLAIQLIP